MQPDDQNQQSPASQPAQNGYVSPSGADVPEYLHMEAVADPVEFGRKRRKKRRVLLLVAIAVIILIAAAFTAYWYVEQNKPQERLYRALESALSVKYVNKKTTYHRDGTGKGTNVEVNSIVDLSDPSSVANESTIVFSRQIKRNGAIADDEYSMRLVKRTKLSLYIESYSGETDLNGLDKKKWIVGNPIKGDIDSRLEEFDASAVLDGTQLVPVMGNYSDATRSKIINTIKSSGMYKVIDTASKDVDGKPLTGMRVGVDRDAINKLNKMIATEAKTGVTHSLLKLVNDTNYEDITFWLNDKNTIVEVDYRNRLQNEDKFRIINSVVFSYPDKVDINEPKE